MSLGADGRDIRRLILGGGTTATAAGLMAGGILAWLGLGHLASVGFGPDALQPGTFLLSGAVLAGVAIAAIWLPARRATRLDPGTAMGTE